MLITKFKIYEQDYRELDPYGEEKWEDASILGYFICDRHRAALDLQYCKTFYNATEPKIYKNTLDAYQAYRRRFFDDSDVRIIRLFSDGEMEILNWNEVLVRINP